MQKKGDRKIIVCDTEKCTGCRLCEYACSVCQDSSLNPRHSRIKVVRVEPVFNVAMSCVACEDRRCIEGCPTQAITYDEKEGHIVIDEQACDGCGLCIERCPYGSIGLSTDGKRAFVCDFCQGQDKPRCVELCPKEALSFKRAEDADFQGMVQHIIKRRSQGGEDG